MTEIEELKAAYEAATPGEWECGGTTVSAPNPDGETRGDYASVCIADCQDDPLSDEQIVANTAFITLAHNMMPELLEAVAQRDKLWEAIGIIGNSSGDFTQNVVNDALTDVGYYPEESPDEEESE